MTHRLKTSPLSAAVLAALREVEYNGYKVLVRRKLPAAVYREFKAALEAAGGEWVRGGIAFAEDPRRVIARLIEQGEAPATNPLNFFPTPAAVADLMAEYGGVARAANMLEPSAGDGELVRGAFRANPRLAVTAIEADPARFEALIHWWTTVLSASPGHNPPGTLYPSLCDFFDVACPGRAYHDVVLMNPPFHSAGNPHAYLPHVGRAFRFLRPGGRLVTVLPESVRGLTRPPRRVDAFRDWVRRAGTFVALDRHAFRGSGADVHCCLAVVGRRGEEFMPVEPEGGSS